MSTQFGDLFGDTYDDVYADKDYAAECDLLERTFRRYEAGETRSILDLGCGTGNHAVALARRGYTVTGVDRSPDMLQRAARKARGPRLNWREGDVRTVELGHRYDAALFMFAVLSYQISNEDVLAALRNARVHLRPGGLLVFDAWHGPGVLTDPPGRRSKIARGASRTISRTASAELDVGRQLCRVHYELSVQANGDTRQRAETHVVRYFFPMELRLFLASSGFSPLSLTPFGELDGELDEHVWNVLVVARAA